MSFSLNFYLYLLKDYTMCLKHDFELTPHFFSHPLPENTHARITDPVTPRWSEQWVAWVFYEGCLCYNFYKEKKNILLSALPG